MGCASLKNKPFYKISTLTYEHLYGPELNQLPKQFKKREQVRADQESTFDHMRFIEKAEFIHIDKIELFMSEGFLQGIAITYTLDGLRMSKLSKCKKMPDTSYELILQPDEHIEFIQIQECDEGILDVMLKTSAGNMLVMDEDHAESIMDSDNIRTFVHNLQDEGCALIGFKGKYGKQYVSSLGFYKAQRLDVQQRVIKGSRNKGLVIQSSVSSMNAESEVHQKVDQQSQVVKKGNKRGEDDDQGYEYIVVSEEY